MDNTPIKDSRIRRFFAIDIGKKSMAMTYVIWFAFGAFGAHRFYTGNRVSGAAMCASTILALIFMVVSVSGATTNPDYNPNFLIGAPIGVMIWMLVIVWVMVDAVLIGISYGRRTADK